MTSPSPFESAARSTEAGNLPSMLAGVLDTAIELASADFGNIQLLDADGRLRIVAQHGFPDWWLDYWNTEANAHGVCGKSLLAGERIIVEDVEQSPIFAGSPALDIQRRADVRAVQSTPLRSQSGQLLGMFSTHYRVPHRPEAKTLLALDLLATHVAALIEREQLQQVLHEREALYRAIVETSADGFWMVDERLRLVAVNDAYAKRSGYCREKLLRMYVTDLDVAHTPQTAREHHEAIFRSGSDLFETTHRAKSGETWPVEVHVTYNPEAWSGSFAFLRDITARKELERELQQSEERFRLAMDAAQEGIWDWNLETGAVYYSPGWAAMLGYSPDDIEPDINAGIGLVHPEDTEAALSTRQLLDDPGHYAREFRMRCKDGRYRWVLSRGKVIARDAEGKATRAIGTHMDITERKLAERDLLASELRLRLFIEHAPVALAMFDDQMRYLAASQRWRDEHAFGNQNIIGQNHYEIFSGVPEGWKAVHRRAMAGETVRAEEERWERADGSVQWLRWEVRPWRTTHGEIGGIIIFFDDITERKHAEVALRESDSRLNRAQEAAQVGTWEWHVRTDRNYWSDETFRLYGLEPGAVAASYETWLNSVHADDRARVAAQIDDSLTRGMPFEIEWRTVNDSRPSRWLLSRGQPQFDGDGHVVRYLGVVMDITQKKRMEEESAIHNELMQGLVKQQVATQTAKAFAHELNQPLVALSAYTEVALNALRRGKTEQLPRLLEAGHAQAHRAGEVLRALIGQLHQGAPLTAPFDLNDLVREVIAKQRKLTQPRFKATLKLEPGLPPVLGNRLQTEKVLENLIQNGVDAMQAVGKAPGALSINARTLKGQSMAHVTIRDSGPGLNNETAGRIFDAFFSTKANGLGLGLPISRSLIEMQGGQLWLDPEAGPGAVFHFTLPFADECA